LLEFALYLYICMLIINAANIYADYDSLHFSMSIIRTLCAYSLILWCGMACL
jgi:hypothetical protein